MVVTDVVVWSGDQTFAAVVSCGWLSARTCVVAALNKLGVAVVVGGMVTVVRNGRLPL